MSRFERDPKRAPRIRITDRDRSLLYDLFHYRVLTTSLLVERQFGSFTRGRNRLKLLYHHGYLDRMFLPQIGPATSEAIYSLGPAAVPELATIYGLEPGEIRRRRTAGRIEPLFLQHELLVARFRIRLAAAGAPYGVGIHDWREHKSAELRFRADGEPVRITPDGMAWLKSRRARFAFCLEADRGTMTVGRVRAKFERYLAAQRSGAMRRLFGADRFRVLVVAPSERRLESLRAAAVSAKAPNVWLTTEDELAGDLVLEPLWRRGAKSGRFPLFKKQQVHPTNKEAQ